MYNLTSLQGIHLTAHTICVSQMILLRNWQHITLAFSFTMVVIGGKGTWSLWSKLTLRRRRTSWINQFDVRCRS